MGTGTLPPEDFSSLKMSFMDGNWACIFRRSSRQRRAGTRCWAVEMKMKKLQSLIPGGQRLKPDRLFLRTADYILHLRLQVNLLQALSKIYKP
ncbi:transcription factor IBH1-like [Juglans regia]|uniref:Transcription factor IBH1-like n=1 Tax=Juglans regia TaxID=51240 RepID=A0A6P9EAX5_JUGRE|nr:transcription factor IBH1-like [Juglans regia]